MIFRPTYTSFRAIPKYCGTVFGLESANVVGYNNVGLNAGGKNMVGACFVNVNNSTVKLSELKVTGYEKSEYY